MKKVLLVFLFLLTINIQLAAQNETEWILKLFNFSSDVTSISDDAVSLAVDAAWLASELTGYETITGTLIQNSLNSWSYTASPSDKLIAIFYDKSKVEFKYSQINGYVDGDAEDFKESHAIDFTTYIENYINIRIISNTAPADGKIQWQRTITGNIILEGDNQSVNIQHSGDRQSEIGSGFAFQYVNETVTGSSSSGLASYSVNDQFHITIAHDSNAGIFNKDTQIWKNSTVTSGGTSYAFQNMNVFYVGGTTLFANAENGIYNQVVNDYQWSSAGTLLKNNLSYGNVIFSESPANSTYGPYLIVKLNSGGDIIIHYLLNNAPTDVKDKSTDIITDYHLSQNYPNPFNPSTKIRYTIAQSIIAIPNLPNGSQAGREKQAQEITSVTAFPRNDKAAVTLSGVEESYVTLKVYDILGREVAVLVNEQQHPGGYEVTFSQVSSNKHLVSGVYFYKIQIGVYSETKKMILQK